MFARAYNLTGGREVGEERCVCVCVCVCGGGGGGGGGREGEREGGKGEGGRGEGGDCVDTHGDGFVGCGVRPLGCPQEGPSGETHVHSQCWHCVGILCTCAHIFTSLVYQHMNIILPSYIMCALQSV